MYNGDGNYSYGGFDNDPGMGGYSGGGKKGPNVFTKIVLYILAGIILSVGSVGVYKMIAGKPARENIEIAATPAPSAEAPVETAAPTQTPDHTTSGNAASLLNMLGSGGDMKSPAEVSEQLLKSVVCIQNYQTVQVPQYYIGGFGGFGFGMPQQGGNESAGTIQLAGEGSGFVLTDSGYIATNAHVVDGAELLKVVLPSGEIYEATLVGDDPDTDLAVIKIESKETLVPVSLGNAEALRVGEFVMAVGNPGGMEFSNSVSLGIVSAKDRPLKIDNGGYTMNTIQTDAAINPGNSGGPLVALDGSVVGICSAKYVDTGFEGLGFAITIDEAMPIIEDLMDYGYVKDRSMIGITGTYVDSVMAKYYNMVEGYYVSTITNPNPGTLQVSDIITQIDGVTVESSYTLKNGIMKKKPGETVELTYYRPSDGKTYTTTVTLIDAHQAQQTNE